MSKTKLNRYGNAIDRYPVVPGSVWAAGPHRFICGSVIEHADLICRHVPKVEALYTDPPWSDGNMTMFYTFAGKEPEGDWADLMDAAVSLIRRVTVPSCPLAFDMGVQFCDEFLGILRRHGFQLARCSATWYGSPRRPACLVLGGWQACEYPVLDGLGGRGLIDAVMAHIVKPGTAYLDPFGGALVFGRAALRRGAVVYASELIPRKLACGLKALERFGLKPHRIE